MIPSYLNTCPECGESDTFQTTETLVGYNRIGGLDLDGDIAWGDTEVDYDSAESQTNIHGQILVRCVDCDTEWGKEELFALMTTKETARKAAEEARRDAPIAEMDLDALFAALVED